MSSDLSPPKIVSAVVLSNRVVAALPQRACAWAGDWRA